MTPPEYLKDSRLRSMVNQQQKTKNALIILAESSLGEKSEREDTGLPVKTEDAIDIEEIEELEVEDAYFDDEDIEVAGAGLNEDSEVVEDLETEDAYFDHEEIEEGGAGAGYLVLEEESDEDVANTGDKVEETWRSNSALPMPWDEDSDVEGWNDESGVQGTLEEGLVDGGGDFVDGREDDTERDDDTRNDGQDLGCGEDEEVVVSKPESAGVAEEKTEGDVAQTLAFIFERTDIEKATKVIRDPKTFLHLPRNNRFWLFDSDSEMARIMETMSNAGYQPVLGEDERTV